MRPARDTLVMLLAGGVGSRLNILASRRAKPAVPFGAAYRIIDFTLSNVMHAGLERVGLLTQYKPFSLMDHVGAGEPWDLVGRERGVKILPPYTGEAESDWFKGTADAVWQNLWFMEDHRPDKVLILSGDHIYRMDYEAMISAHERAGAALTIAAMPVPWDRSKAFQILNGELLPGRVVKTSAGCLLMGVATSGENELAPSCYPAGEPVKKREGEEEARLPRVTFRFHTGGRHLVAVAESDFTVDNLASDYHSAPAGTLFSGVVEISEFKYGDGPTYNYYPTGNRLQIHCRLLNLRPIKAEQGNRSRGLSPVRPHARAL